MPATVKGILFLGIKKGIIKYFSEAGFSRFLSELPKEHRSFWDQSIYPITPVPVEYFMSMCETILGMWDAEKFEKIVAELAYEDLNAAMRFFLKIGTPSFIAPRFPKIFNQYFSEGSLKILQLEKTSLDLELSGAEVFGRGCCFGTLAWVRMALEYSGAKNMKADHEECLFKHSKQCLFHFRWE